MDFNSHLSDIKKAMPYAKVQMLLNIGDYQSIITIRESDLTVKFLFSDFMKSPPEIIVLLPKLKPQDLTFVNSLCKISFNRLGSLSIESFMKECVETIANFIVKNKAEDKATTNKKSRKCNVSKISHEKKASMRTAIDVIKRILWDSDTCRRDEFYVGYTDRFFGIMERNFTSFSWADISSVDDFEELAIPKHRIQYFKYRDIKVWDKRDRFDNVFGSTGSGITIADIVKMERDKEQLRREAAVANCSAAADDAVRPADDDAAAEYDFSTDSDDDSVHVTLDDAEIEDDEDETALPDEATAAIAPYLVSSFVRPNHFLALRITDPHIQSVTEDIQDSIERAEWRLQECFARIKTLHVTLATLKIDTDEQRELAIASLRPDELRPLADDVILSLTGLGVFNERVLYAKVADNVRFNTLVDHVRLSLRSEGISLCDGFQFTPHMSIVKISRPVARQMKTNRLEPALYESMGDVAFGTQSVDEIHLCAMGQDRRSDGFYKTLATIKLQ